MTENLAIIIEDPDTFSDICGVNDSNLKVLENLLEVSVFSRGNELHVASSDDRKSRIFRQIIDQLKDHSKLGHIPNPDLIQAVIHSVRNGESKEIDLLKNYTLTVPQRNITVFPKSINQAYYIKKLAENDIVFGIGPAGTGKTYIAVANAVKRILSKETHKIVLTRPVVEAGESLGFLPGDFTQKISPYLRPLYDALDTFLSPEMISRMEENRIIEIVPLAYMRGRSLSKSLIILDEAQNTTKAQMKMFLTRIGQDSTAVITGDVTQIDLPSKKQSGLLHVMKLLRSVEGIHFCFFDTSDVVRNPLVKKIVQAYENEENNNK